MLNAMSPPTTSFELSHAGRPIHVTELGKGEPAILLLSGLGDPALWWFRLPTPDEARPHWRGNIGEQRSGVAPRLATTARVVAYDRAGIGNSPAPDHDRTWAEIYAELEAVLAALNLTQPPVLVGHSLGGLIAYTYARRYPQAVGGLVLLDATPPPLSQPPSVPMPERLALTHFEPDELAPEALGHLPLSIVSPGRALTVAEAAEEGRNGTPDALSARFEKRRAQHEQLLSTSTRSRAVWTVSPSHYVHLDEPDVVTEAILSVWELTQKRKPQK